MKWSLSNGAENAANDSFEIPNEWKSLQPGSFVKLNFINHVRRSMARFGGESMWVEITEIVADGSYIGRLDNHPTVIHGLKAGDKIAFKLENVFGVLPSDA